MIINGGPDPDRTVRPPQRGMHRQFIRDAFRKLNNPQLRVEENDFAILITDFTPAQISAFSKMIPTVFTYMNRQFGVPLNQTVLPGKAIIAVFGQRENFANFETVVMDNANFGSVDTLWRFNSRRFLVVRHDKSFDADSIRAICVTLADGYFGRFIAMCRCPFGSPLDCEEP